MNIESILSSLKTCIYCISGFIFSYLGLCQEAINILTILIVLDVITGLVKASILGHEITSRKGISGITAKLIILLIPPVLVITGRGAGIDLIGVAGSALSFFVLFEGYSVIGNIYSIYTKQDVKEIDAISIFMKYILSILKSIIENVMSGKK